MAPSTATETTTLLPKPHNAPKKLNIEFVSFLLLVIIALASTADGISYTPLTRVFESIVCYKYWEQHDPSKLSLPRSQLGPGAIGGVPEEFCKVAPIQSEVALIKGWQIFFDGLPGLIVGVPLGALADRIGRKPIIIVGVLSLTIRLFWMEVVCWFWQSLPVRLTWLSGLVGLISGGAPVVAAICLCVVSDLSTASTRTIYLLRITGASMIFNYTGPTIGAAIMVKHSPWIVLYISTALWVSATVLTCFIPETLNYSHPSLEHAPLRPTTQQDPTDLLVDVQPHVAKHSETPRSFKQLVHRVTSSISSNAKYLVSDSRILLLISPYVGLMLGEATRDMLVLYASVRYRVTLADATFLAFGGAISKALTLLILIPAITYILQHLMPSLAPMKRDLVLARISIVLQGVGWLATGLAPNRGAFVAAVIVTALGIGANSLCRSFLTEIVGKQNAGKLYAIISVIECLALVLSGPLLSGLWTLALHLGGIMIGLPFYFNAGIYALTTVALLLVRVRKGEDGTVKGDEESAEQEREGLLGEERN